jgi:predicted nucleotidyltransferase
MTTLTAKPRFGKLISRGRIQRLVDEIARAFSPSRIILFGSYATGKATPDSDVDLLVLFKTKKPRDMSFRIRQKIEWRSALDLVVMDEARLAKRLSWGDFFLMDIMESGKVLYESAHP